MNLIKFALLFVITPLVIDLIIVIIGSYFSGKKVVLIILLTCYIFLNVVAPVLILFNFYFDLIGNINVVSGVAFILLFRLLEIFGFSLGKAFLHLWSGKPAIRIIKER